MVDLSCFLFLTPPCSTCHLRCKPITLKGVEHLARFVGCHVVVTVIKGSAAKPRVGQCTKQLNVEKYLRSCGTFIQPLTSLVIKGNFIRTCPQKLHQNSTCFAWMCQQSQRLCLTQVSGSSQDPNGEGAKKS